MSKGIGILETKSLLCKPNQQKSKFYPKLKDRNSGGNLK